MPEVKIAVQTYEVDMVCPNCGCGMMRPTNVALTTYPLQYPHDCVNCGHTEIYYKQYPYIKYEEMYTQT